MKHLFLFSILLFSFLSCNRDDEKYHDVELKVTSTGTFRVKYDYSRNPEKSEAYNNAPPVEYSKSFSKKVSLKWGEDYSLNVYPTSPTSYEHTAQIIVDGKVIRENTGTYSQFGGTIKD